METGSREGALVMSAIYDDSRSNAILVTTSVFLATSLVSVGLRCFVRTHIVRAFGWDDIVMLLAMALNLGFAICGILGSKYGMGRKLAYFGMYPDNLHKALLCWWLGQVLYVCTCIIAKISIIISLLRITVNRIHVWILYAAIFLATVVGLIFLFFTIFQCNPVGHFWNQLSESGTCIDVDVLLRIAYLYSVGAAVTDLTIGLLPVALIWNLRMNRRAKFAVIGVLGIGCIASAAVIIRIPYLHHYKDQEFLYNTYQISIWSNVEAGLGITAGCLTTLRPLIRFLRDGSSASRSRNRTPGSFPLSSNVVHAYNRPTRRSKLEDKDDVRHLWTGTDPEDYQVTTIVMSNQHPNPTSNSEENLSPSSNHDRDGNTGGWKVERSIRVSVQNS